jgi:hypothetical protein
MNKILVSGIVTTLQWGIAGSVLSILKNTGAFQLISENVYQSAAYGTSIQAVQLDFNKIKIEGKGKNSTTFETAKRIKSFAISSDLLVIWTGSLLEINRVDGIQYLKVENLEHQALSTLNCFYDMYAICNHCVVVCKNSTIEVLNTKTMISQCILIPSDDGNIINTCSTTSSLKILLLTDKTILKQYEIFPDIKLIHSKKLEEIFPHDRSINMAVNSKDNYVVFSGNSHFHFRIHRSIIV